MKLTKRNPLATSLALTLALLAAGALAIGCSQTESVVKGDSTISQIDRNPEDWIGRTVTLTGNIEEVFGPSAFEIESDRLLDDELLVVIPGGIDVDGYLVENRTATLTGRVERMSASEVAVLIGDDDDMMMPVSYSGMRTVIVVDSVSVMSR